MLLQQEIMFGIKKKQWNLLNSEKRLLRPQNLAKGSPGNGFGIFNSKNKKKLL